MKILSIESSCDETAAAVVEDGRKVLSSAVNTQIAEHVIYGGVVPEIASRRHCENIGLIVRSALSQAGLSVGDVDAVAATYAPGLIGALLVGLNFAKGLAYSAGKPLIPVHHLRSHIASNYISHPELEPPFLALVVSGGHTSLIDVTGYTELRIIGSTRDDAAGEALDKAARAMGIPYPGGANMDKLAADGDPFAYKLPRPEVDGSPFDFSFSGLKTSVINLLHNAGQTGKEIDIRDLGASYMQTIAQILVSKTALALDEYPRNKLVVAGGVSANSVLRREMKTFADKRGISLYFPELRYCGDNAAMVGAQAYYEKSLTGSDALKINAFATMDIDKQLTV